MFKKCTVKNSEGEKIFQLEIADTFLKRFLGLMGRKKIPVAQGLLILPCNSIHMMFMRFSIDAVYIDENFVVKKIVRNLMPWLGMSICAGAHAVIELAAGEADRLNFQIGSKIIF
ncbi:MAG: DUF192 domain-containing protein [Selenomonadaceae bacterium]|nr:DUF192 domain-containing protein [Selenomonadaceae bacterium]